MSSLGAPWRPSNPVGGEAATTTGVTTHRRRAHEVVQRRPRDDACQPAVRRIGIRTRVFSHSNTSSVALPVAGANLSVSVSTGAPSDSVFTVPAPTSAARTSLSIGTPQRWTPRLTTICHFEAPGITRSEEHTSELQSQSNLVCRLLLEKKKKTRPTHIVY